jgi:hypothetical protein
MLLLVDSHLDLAENVTLFGRDLTLEVRTLRALEQHTRGQIIVTLIRADAARISVIGLVLLTEVREAVLSTNWLVFLKRSLS